MLPCHPQYRACKGGRLKRLSGAAHLKHVLGSLFVERELFIELGRTTSIIQGLGFVCLVAEGDPVHSHRKQGGSEKGQMMIVYWRGLACCEAVKRLRMPSALHTQIRWCARDCTANGGGGWSSTLAHHGADYAAALGMPPGHSLDEGVCVGQSCGQAKHSTRTEPQSLQFRL